MLHVNQYLNTTANSQLATFYPIGRQQGASTKGEWWPPWRGGQLPPPHLESQVGDVQMSMTGSVCPVRIRRSQGSDQQSWGATGTKPQVRSPGTDCHQGKAASLLHTTTPLKVIPWRNFKWCPGMQCKPKELSVQAYCHRRAEKVSKPNNAQLTSSWERRDGGDNRRQRIREGVDTWHKVRSRGWVSVS